MTSILLAGLPAFAEGLPCNYDVTEVMGPYLYPFGQTKVRLYDINDAGLAVGQYNLLISAKQPCTWTDEDGVEAIPVGVSGISDAEAVKVNNNNWILVNAQTSRGRRGFVLIPNDAGSWDWVEMIPIAESPSESFVHDLNDKNQVVGTQSAGPSGNYPQAGFLWSLETGRVDIAIEGWASTGCIAINDAGTIAGDVSQTAQASGFESTHAFVLQQGSSTIVQPPAPYTRSWSAAINDEGIAAGGFSDFNGSQTIGVGFTIDTTDGAVQWYSGPREVAYWWIRDINDLGVMCGALHVAATNTTRACVSNGSEFLELTPFSPPSSQFLWDAFAIRNDGVMVARCNSKCATVLTPAAAKAGDIDCDGVVGGSDLAVVIGAWGSPDPGADLDGNGIVDGGDIGIVLGNWTQP